ncbi:MAG: hypothetical protein ACI4GB_07090 [Acutalibacteraceae bacterium]
MKNTMKIKLVIIMLIVVVGTFITISLIPSDKKVSGNWQLNGVLQNNELKFGDFGEYEYFNIYLSEDGVINIFSYPQTFGDLGTYFFLKKQTIHTLTLQICLSLKAMVNMSLLEQSLLMMQSMTACFSFLRKTMDYFLKEPKN